MSKELYQRNKVMTKAEFEKLKLPAKVWDDQTIPPLVTLTNPKPKKQKRDEIQLQSLNQSQVNSIYTVDREDFDKHMLDIMNSTMRSQKMNRKSVEIKEQLEPDWSTPINKNKGQSQYQATKRDLLSTFREEQHEYLDYGSCQAIRLYQELVEQPLQLGQQGRAELDWIQNKSPHELVANVLTNKHRMNVYVRYILHQIYLNQEAKVVNYLHQEEIRHYNPDLKEAYTNILYLLGKVGKADLNERKRGRPGGKSPPAKEGPRISLFENGVSIDIDPHLSEAKRQQNLKIRELRNNIMEQERQFQEKKKIYEQIIMNYLISMEQIQKLQDEQNQRPQLQQSMVRMDILHEDEQDMIRNKNHTFGMRSGRGSKDYKK